MGRKNKLTSEGDINVSIFESFQVRGAVIPVDEPTGVLAGDTGSCSPSSSLGEETGVFPDVLSIIKC